MRKSIVMILGLLVLSLALSAASPAPVQPAEKPAAETATYSVPGLDQEALVKSLSKSLAEKPGIVGAQADKVKGTFAVTFETAKIDAEQILKALVAVAPEVKLQGVAPAATTAAAKHDCGKCPSRSSCGSHK